MANPILRSYVITSSATPSTWTALGSPVPTGRALVVSKLIVANLQGIAQAFGIRNNVTTGRIASSVPLDIGDVYTESGIVLIAGHFLEVWSSIASGITVTLYGEEVDN